MIPIAYTPGIDRPHPAMILLPSRGPTLAGRVAMERWRPSEPGRGRSSSSSSGWRRGGSCSGSCVGTGRSSSTTPSRPSWSRCTGTPGAGEEPVPPALLAMALLLQGYLGVSDSEAVERRSSTCAGRWCSAALARRSRPSRRGRCRVFASGSSRTTWTGGCWSARSSWRRRTKEFDWKKLPKTLRVAIDSSPLEGAGRVEDTINLLAHAARKVVECAAELLGWTAERVCREARAPLLVGPSVKKALDIDWSDPGAEGRGGQGAGHASSRT